jgi:hypothetical protein
MPTKSKITESDYERFCVEYISNGHNAGRAFKKIRPNVTDGTSRVQGFLLLKKSDIKDRIAEIEENDLVEMNITRQRTMQAIGNIGYTPIKKTNTKEGKKELAQIGPVVIRALDLLSKIQKLQAADTTLPEDNQEEHIHFYIPENRRFQVVIKKK